ncbi:MAG: hypothetical protein HWD92_12405 [Flavobacteriia bacterium]|nr:hypothetical protein [Flavobacteriia bacterium]
MKKLIAIFVASLVLISCGPQKDLPEGDMVRLQRSVTGIQGIRMLNFWYQSQYANGTQVDSVVVEGVHFPAQWAPTTEIQIMEGQVMLEVRSDAEGEPEVQPHPVYGVLMNASEVTVELYIQGEFYGLRSVKIDYRDEDVQ